VAGYRLAPVHVGRPRGLSGRRSSLAVLHEVKRLLPRHVTVLKDVPVVRPERMVLDLCAGEHPRRAARALDDAWRRRLLSGRSLRALVSETSVQGRPGLSLLRALVDERGDDYVPPASNLEARFASIITQAGLPEMRRQVDSGDDERWVGRVDFRDVDRPLIVEIQSETFHTASPTGSRTGPAWRPCGPWASRWWRSRRSRSGTVPAMWCGPSGRHGLASDPRQENRAAESVA
jgi:hypothetical protein